VKRIIRKKQCHRASLKAHLHVLFWYGHETCCQILLKFFYGCKLIISEPNPQSLEGPDAAHSKLKRIKWLGSGWNLDHQKLMHCEEVIGCNVMVKDPIVSPYFSLFQ
jgi:hypothetical protein